MGSRITVASGIKDMRPMVCNGFTTIRGKIQMAVNMAADRRNMT